jgi:ABC-type Fe3+/spermidine/putrescine transport system ATPase subunit
MSSETVITPDINRVPGIIENIVYKGSFTLYYVRVEGRYQLTVQRISGGHQSEEFKLNQKVYLNWTREDTFILCGRE